MTGRACIVCLALGACFFDHAGLPGETPDGGVTPDVAPGGDVADIDAVEGPDARPDAEPCVDECTAPDSIKDCSMGGAEHKCDLGCVDAIMDHCAVMVPSNGFDPTWVRGADAALTVPNGETWVFDSDTGRISTCGAADIRPAGVGMMNEINFQTIPAPSMGAAVGVFAFTSLTVEDGGEIRGVGGAAMGIIVSGTVTILGTITVTGGARACDATEACAITTGDRKCAGPGGGDGGLTIGMGFGMGGGDGGAGGDGSTIERGGGGGGFSGTGGAGGGIGGSGGGVYGAVEPLIGGSGGGGGGTDMNTIGGWGGGGGGAIQITALTAITITEISGGAAAGVQAGGAGGGYATGTAGGGGGGSGGGILLEAPTIQVEFGRVAANGGGGGGTPGAADNFLPFPGPGEDGPLAIVGAAGGSGTNVGGAGGALAGVGGGNGSPFAVSADAGSGGGGGAGRVTLKTADPARLITSTPQFSPMATTTTISTQ